MKKGFTLVELAIVLVAIGLIAGAVVVGSSMIKSAQLQAVISDVKKYTEAAYSFNEKYGYWPGDIVNATDYWSAASNGDGNGELPNPGTSTSEYWYFWDHLERADFIDGSYSGASNSVPTGGIKASYLTHYYTAASTTYQAFALAGDEVPNAATYIIDGKDGYSIDLKIDDGLPSAGDIQAVGNCVTASAYEMTTTDLCNLIFYYKKD